MKKKLSKKKTIISNQNKKSLNLNKKFKNLIWKLIMVLNKENFLNLTNNKNLFKFLIKFNWNNKGLIYKNIDGVASIKGLFKAPMLGILKFGKLKIYQTKDNNFKYKLSLISNVMGLILTLNEDTVLSFIIGNERKIKPLHIAILDRKIPMINVNKYSLGTVVNSLGINLDKKNLNTLKGEDILLENEAPGIIERSEVNEKLLTGLKSVDSMIPIGKGQRELIIGDRQTGKTAIALDTILNQNINYHFDVLPKWAIREKGFIKLKKNKKKELKNFFLTKPKKLLKFYKKKKIFTNQIYSIYVGIGQKNSSIAQLSYRLHLQGALDNSIIVAANASDSAALQYLAPYTGCAIGEWLSNKGFHSLVIYDDLSKHAVAYRQMALLLRRSPGREAYPGDVFYLHSRLLERATKFNLDNGFGSLTALPIIETQAGDVSAYIPTNVISITDGQIFLETILFNRGIRPAINVGISVSRIGSKAQSKIMKTLAGTLKLDLAQYREVEYFANFGSSLDKTTQLILHRGERLVEILKQEQYKPLRLGLQIWVLYCAMLGFIDKLNTNMLKLFENILLYLTTIKEEGLVVTEIFEEQYKFSSKVFYNNKSVELKTIFQYWIVVFLNFLLKKILWKMENN